MPRVSAEHLEARRRQIMEAAVSCFARQGFHRATMQDIVAESGMSAGALYRYFQSKDDIVAAIAKEHHAPEASLLAAAAETDDVGAVLRRLVEVSLGRLASASEQRWRRVTVQMWSEALREPAIMEVVRAGLDGPLAILADVIRRGQRDGRMPAELDPEATARVCAAIFQGLVLQQAWEPDVDISSYLDSVLVLVGALERSAAAPPRRPAGIAEG